MKILVLEDDSKVRLLLKSIIESYNYTTIEFIKAEDALIEYKKSFYPIIIVDVDLPGMNGLDFCRQIRKLPRGEDSIIIVETGVVVPERLQEVLSAGVDDYIFKPIDVKLFKIRLEIAVKQSHDRIERRKMERKYRDLVELSPDIIHSVDKDGYILSTNKRATEILGYSKDELIGMHIRQLYAPEEWEKLKIGFKKLKKEGFRSPIESLLLAKNGERIEVEVSSTASYDEKGNFLLSRSILRDIRGRKKAERALRDSERKLQELNASKAKFFSIIAHDIKNPLGAIVGFSDLLMKHYKELMEKDKIEYIKDINLSSKQLLNLLENLLEWSRSQTGKLQLSPDIFDLSYIINSCITLLQTNAESKNIRLFSEVKKGMKVFVDVETITTVIRNLITNAIKFTNFGGEVKITAQDIEDYIQVEINDNGVGINEDDISKLFRIDVSYSTQGTAGEKGTGLGLILCKEFIKKNSGKIWVESQIGKGSTFKFTLPKFRQ